MITDEFNLFLEDNLGISIFLKESKLLKKNVDLDYQRLFESKITHFFKRLINIDDESITELTKAISNDKYAKDFYFSCFFLVFTYYRKRNHLEKALELFKKYEHFFYDYYLLNHIEMMAYSFSASTKNLNELIDKAINQLDYYENYIGFYNLYSEICLRYYEFNLELLNTPLAKERLNIALDKEKYAVMMEPKYHKFLVNLGRIYTLLADYDKAEESILKAISMVEENSLHDKTVSDYNVFYVRISSYKFHTSSSKQREDLNNFVTTNKIDNLKNISIIGSVIAFLLGGIEIFANVSDIKIISTVMILYASLFVAIISFILIISSLSIFKKFSKNLLPNILCVITLTLSIAVFLFIALK